MSGVQTPTDILATISMMREAVYKAWQQFVAKMPFDDLAAEDCWLLLQLSSGPATRGDIQSGLLMFVDQPDGLLRKAIERGWVREIPGDDVRYELTEQARTFFRQLLPIAQASNASWRATLRSDQQVTGDLDFVLGMLQGRQSTGS